MLYFIFLTIFLHTINAEILESDPSEINIVGGSPVDIRSYPYQARLENNKELLCGASILTRQHVLCAAHCIIFSPGPITVHAGTSLLSVSGSVHHVEHNVTFGSQSDADVAVLRVTEPIIFDAFRQPIKLFTITEDPRPDVMAVVTGWGYTNGNGPSNQLMAVQVPIVSREICNRIYEHTVVGVITVGQICAGYLNTGGKDACEGDSGGPLVINGRQAGIISKGYGCARRRAPGVYTSIAYYHDWISKQILL